MATIEKNSESKIVYRSLSEISPEDLEESFQSSIQPMLFGYQMLGDSIFVRFASNILKQPYKVICGSSTIGYCVSGQRIKQLSQSIKRKDYCLTKTVMVLIGTNDILCGRSLHEMIEDFNNLLTLLKAFQVSKFCILTLPPIPRLAMTRSHWEVVRGFNQFLIDMNDPASNFDVLDILPLFMREDIPSTLIPSYENSSLPIEDKLEFKSPKKRKVFDSNVISEDEENLPGFGTYLDRINRMEYANSLISDEEEWAPKVKPYIDYPFWKDFINSLSLDKDDGWCEEQYDTGSFPTSSSVDEVSKVPEIGNTLRTILENCDRVIRLNCFEKYMGSGNNLRADMIHPNSTGLRRVSTLLKVHCKLKKKVNSVANFAR